MNNNSKNNFQVEFANTAGMLASRLSLSPTVGQIYGLLYMSPEPVSLNEMVEKLGISKGSASVNIRILESWGAVRKVWVDNTRKDYYEANIDTLKIIIDRLREGLLKRFSEANQKLNLIEEDLNKKTGEKDREQNKFYVKKINMVKDIYNQVISLMEILPGQE